MMPEPLRVSIDAGPVDPPSSAKNAGLVPGTVWRYDLTGRPGDAKLADGFIVAPNTSYRVALYPAMSFDDEASDPRPNWGALHVGVKFVCDGEQFAATDQYGHWFLPDDPSWLVADQWNLLDLDMSGLVGRTIDEVILVGADGATGHGWVQLIGETPLADAPSDPIDYVRTTRGSHSGYLYSRGNTYPAVSVPHGAHFVTPLTDARERGWLYRWHPAEGRTHPRLEGLAFAHAPSPWIGDRNGFQLMAWLGSPSVVGRGMDFSHDDEYDRPHLYRVDLATGVRAEATATERCGFFRFTFPQPVDGPRRALRPATRRDAGRGILLDQATGGTVTAHALPDGRVAFEAYVPGYDDRQPPAYVYGETLQPASATRIRGWRSLINTSGFTTNTLAHRVARLAGKLAIPSGQSGSASLRLTSGDVLEVKAAMSFISVEQAKRTLDLEVGAKGFDEVASKTRDRWREFIDRLTIEGGSRDQLTSAYSNLVRLFCWPNAHHENAGTTAEPRWVYASPFHVGEHTPTHTGCEVREGTLYVNNGYWDTYRTAWPAYHLLNRAHAGELLDGILTQYNDSGYMSRWSAPGHVDCMTGTSSDAIFADAAAHRIDFDELTAYDSALKNASVPSANPDAGRKQIATARYVGWVDTSEEEGFGWSVENANCDAAISRWSGRLAERADELGVGERRDEFLANERYFANRSLLLRELFDPRVGFFQGRDPDRARRVPAAEFDPRIWGYDYTETNAWGMAFSAVHDGPGLAKLYGGEDGLAAKLEEALATQESSSEHVRGSYPYTTHEMSEARNIRLGMIAISNQPAHHIPYMFCHAGQPWRTQWLTREILDRLFVGSDVGQGYPGDEDNGEMSAWWLFSAMGLYPLWVGSGEFVITAPLFEKLSWRLDDEATLTVVGHGAGQGHRYIQSVTVNGEPWDTVTIPVDLLRTGPTIEMILGPIPSRWGADSRPGSIEGQTALGDLTETAHANLTDPTGRDHVANVVTDDTGAGFVDAAPGSVLTLRWGHDVAPTFFTITSDSTDTPEFALEYLMGPDWHPIEVTPNSPRFANQPTPTLLPGGLQVRGLRWRFGAPCRLRQIEVY